MRRAAGFTLMEVLAVLVLLGFLLVGVYAGLHTATRTVRGGSQAAARLDQLRSAQQLLRRELAQAMPVPLARNDHGDPLFFVGQPQQLSYVAPLPGYLGALGAQLQTLRLVDDGHGLQLQLQLAMLPPDGGAPMPVGTPQVLVDHVRSGHFAYRGVDATGQVSGWLTQWPDGRWLPGLVRIELQLQGRYPWPTLLVPLRIDTTAAPQGSGLLRRLGGGGA